MSDGVEHYKVGVVIGEDRIIDAYIKPWDRSAGQSIYRWYVALFPDGTRREFPNEFQARHAIRAAIKGVVDEQ